MVIKRVLIFFGLVLFLAACSSRTPDPLIKEDVQTSSQEDYEYLKETSANAPRSMGARRQASVAGHGVAALREPVESWAFYDHTQHVTALMLCVQTAQLLVS